MQLYAAHANRTADQLMADRYATPTLLLMEAAGQGAAAAIVALGLPTRSAVVLCGSGNNGGDGYVVARVLHLAGWAVAVLQTHPEGPTTPDALVNYRICQAMGLRMEGWTGQLPAPIVEALRQGAVCVDALLGTGTTGPVRGAAAEVVAAVRALSPYTVALDVPSGLCADTGQVATEPIAAAHTLSFGLAKPCHYLTPAASYCGQVQVVPIGLLPAVVGALPPTAEVLTPAWLAHTYRPRPRESHKGTFGHVLVVGGQAGMAGAPALAAAAAVAAGAGLVSAYIPKAVQPAFHHALLEAMSIAYTVEGDDHLGPEALPRLQEALLGKQVVVVGPGLGATPATLALLEGLLAHLPALAEPPTLLLDADALNLLAAHPHLLSRVPRTAILTPHPGEMARLVGTTTAQVQAQRLETASAWQAHCPSTVVLKGMHTLITSPGYLPAIAPVGGPGLATGGMGDVLAGVIAAWVAQGYAPHTAACLGVYQHGATADRLTQHLGPEAVTPIGLIEALGPTLHALLHT